MTRCTRTLVLAAASLGLVATAAAATSAVAAAEAPGVEARIATFARESATIATWAKSQGLVGLSPASLQSAPAAAAAPRYARDVFAS